MWVGHLPCAHAGSGLCHPFWFVPPSSQILTISNAPGYSAYFELCTSQMAGHCSAWGLILLLYRLPLFMSWLVIKVEFLAQPKYKGRRRAWCPWMNLVWLLFEREKLDTAGGCSEEEMCFTLPEWFLHLIQVGMCENGWVRLSFLMKVGLSLLTSPSSWGWLLI